MSGGGPEGGVRVDTGRLTSGVDGVQRLCKALISARFIEMAMDTWGEELFFLELWTEINHRASLRARAEAYASLPDPKNGDAEIPDGTIFEELIHQYAKTVSSSGRYDRSASLRRDRGWAEDTFLFHKAGCRTSRRHSPLRHFTDANCSPLFAIIIPALNSLLYDRHKHIQKHRFPLI